MAQTTIISDCLYKGAEYKTVDIDLIDYNEENDYEASHIEELADDIKRNGLLHNLVVTPKENGRYKLLAGERRLRAIRLLNENGAGDKYKNIAVLVIPNLTPRKEEIIMDSSNLHARSAGGNEEQLRKATNRYMDNIKEEYGLTEKEALKATTELYSGSGNTIRTNRTIGKGLNEQFTAELDSGNIEKGDAAVIAQMSEDAQDALFEDYDNAATDDDKQNVIDTAVTEHKEEKKRKKAEKKAVKKPIPAATEDTDPYEATPDKAGEITSYKADPRITTRMEYLSKVNGMIDLVKAMNNPDNVAQIARLDSQANSDETDTVLARINILIMEATALKNAIKNSDGDFDTGIDPITGHHSPLDKPCKISTEPTIDDEIEEIE